MNYEKSARNKAKKVPILSTAGKESDDHLDTLLSFKDRNQFKPNSPRSPDSTKKQKQVDESYDLVMGRRIKMAAKQESNVKYELCAKPLL
jgi:hypothetical protein